jgi:hypothetical protein
MKERLAIVGRLLACVPRLIAAVVTGNLDAIDALHERWHG